MDLRIPGKVCVDDPIGTQTQAKHLGVELAGWLVVVSLTSFLKWLCQIPRAEKHMTGSKRILFLVLCLLTRCEEQCVHTEGLLFTPE